MPDGQSSEASQGTGTVFRRANGSARRRRPPSSIELTFGEYLTDWLEDQALLLKATTAARNRNLGSRCVLRHRIARRPVRDLAPKGFRAFWRELADHGKAGGSGLATGSIATLDQVLKSALRRIVDDGGLPWNRIQRRIVKVEASERPWLDSEQLGS